MEHHPLAEYNKIRWNMIIDGQELLLDLPLLRDVHGGTTSHSRPQEYAINYNLVALAKTKFFVPTNTKCSNKYKPFQQIICQSENAYENAPPGFFVPTIPQPCSNKSRKINDFVPTNTNCSNKYAKNVPTNTNCSNKSNLRPCSNKYKVFQQIQTVPTNTHKASQQIRSVPTNTNCSNKY